MDLSDSLPRRMAPTVGMDITARGLLDLVWRARFLILLFFVPTVLATYVVMKQRPRTYTAEGALIVGGQRSTIRELDAAIGSLPGDVAYARSEMSVLTSRSIVRKTAEILHLDRDPEFNPLLRPPPQGLLSDLDPRPALDRFIAAMSAPSGNRPSGAPISDADAKAEEAAFVDDLVENSVLAGLDVSNDGRDYVLHVQFKGQSPRIASELVNTLMEQYTAAQVAAKVAANTEASSVLNDRIAALQQDATAAADRLQDYATKAGVVETRMGSVTGQQLADTNAQLTTARADRVTLEARYQQALAAQQAGTLSSASTDVLDSPLIQRLRGQEAELVARSADLATRLGPNHPDYRAVQAQLRDTRAVIATEVGKVLASLRSQVDAARAREAALQGRLGTTQSRAQSSAESDAVYQRLKSDADAKQRIYADFLARVAQTARPGDQQRADAQIISRAVPPIAPSGPRVMLTTGISGLVSILLAVTVALLWRSLDRGFASLDEVEHHTGLPGLAALPEIRLRGRRQLPQNYVLEHPYSPFAETLRGFRARMKSLAGERPLKTLLVTSSVPGEGKTSFALALARLSARDGQNVLMIECDLRRPTLHGVLPSKDVDLIDVFSGKANWKDSVGTDEPSGLHYITAHEDVPAASPLFEAPGFGRLIQEARTHYDLVIIDSPPVMRVSDASLLARSADAVLLIVGWRQTRRQLAVAALKRLSADRSLLLGVVLTKVNARKAGADMYSGYSR